MGQEVVNAKLWEHTGGALHTNVQLCLLYSFPYFFSCKVISTSRFDYQGRNLSQDFCPFTLIYINNTFLYFLNYNKKFNQIIWEYLYDIFLRMGMWRTKVLTTKPKSNFRIIWRFWVQSSKFLQIEIITIRKLIVFLRQSIHTKHNSIIKMKNNIYYSNCSLLHMIIYYYLWDSNSSRNIL